MLGEDQIGQEMQENDYCLKRQVLSALKTATPEKPP
jgi:hypothetical protein